MHVRFSTVIGLPIVEQAENDEIALLSGILIHPDTGKVEGFFVHLNSLFHGQELFLPSLDIVHWGKRIQIRDADRLSPIEDLVRMESILADGRTVLHQQIVTENGLPLGRCADVQFDTTNFMLEWLFPKKFFRWRTPLPASSIVQVRTDAVVVRDAVTIPEVATGPSVLETLDPLGTSGVQRSRD